VGLAMLSIRHALSVVRDTPHRIMVGYLGHVVALPLPDVCMPLIFGFQRPKANGQSP